MRIQYIKVDYSVQSSPSSSFVLSNTRLPLNPTLRVLSCNTSIPSKWFFCIFQMILNLLERILKTDFTFSATSLYFFTKKVIVNICYLVQLLTLLIEIYTEKFLIDQHTFLELCLLSFLLLLLTTISIWILFHKSLSTYINNIFLMNSFSSLSISII